MMSISSRTFRERVLRLGSEENIVAIATDPDHTDVAGTRPGPVRPTLIFLNAGVLHRVGPHRLHVSLARVLANSGLASLRVDLSGIGDSRGVPGSMSFRASAVADTRAAMDRTGIDTGTTRFVLFGMCSGADNALATAQADPRVVGLVLIDPPAYATVRARIRAVLQRALQPCGIAVKVSRACEFLALLPRRLALSLGQRLLPGRHSGNPVAPGRQPPPRAAYGALLTQLVDRGVNILCIYSGANYHRYNHRDQIFEAFPALRERIDVAFFPTANHVFTELAQRSELVATVRRWCDDRFP